MFDADRGAHCIEFFREMNTLHITEIYSLMHLIFVYKSLKWFGVADMYQVYNTCLNSKGGPTVPFAKTNLLMNRISDDAAVR